MCYTVSMEIIGSIAFLVLLAVVWREEFNESHVGLRGVALTVVSIFAVLAALAAVGLVLRVA